MRNQSPCQRNVFTKLKFSFIQMNIETLEGSTTSFSMARAY